MYVYTCIHTCCTEGARAEEECSDGGKTPGIMDEWSGVFEDGFSEEGEDDVVRDLESEVMKSSNIPRIRTRQ